MTIRPAERRLPDVVLQLTDANRRAVRAFGYGSVLFGGLGFAIGFLIGWAA